MFWFVSWNSAKIRRGLTGLSLNPKPKPRGPTFGASEHSEVEYTLKTLRGDIEIQQKLLEKLTSIIKTARLRCEEAALLLEERNMLQERILTLEEERASARRTEQETRKELESLRLALAEHELEWEGQEETKLKGRERPYRRH